MVSGRYAQSGTGVPPVSDEEKRWTPVPLFQEPQAAPLHANQTDDGANPAAQDNVAAPLLRIGPEFQQPIPNLGSP